jgi:SpoIIAA-like
VGRIGIDDPTGLAGGAERRESAREVEGDAMTADTGFRARFATSFDRVAVVSDESWMRPAMRALSFLLPGKAKAFPVAELPDAKVWLAESGT